MKILVASDIHGSAYYASKVFEAAKRFNVDKVCLLGDILYHGPRNPLPIGHGPMEVVDIINANVDKVIGVRGNCDAEIDRALLKYDLSKDFISFPFEDRTVYLTHGHVYGEDHFPEGIKENDILIFGHIHVPVYKKVNGIFVLNPGSTSLPKNDTPHSLLVIEGKEATYFDISNDEFKPYKKESL